MLSEYMTGLQHIGIPTEDLEATITFYQKLGFTLRHRAADGDTQVSFLELQNVMMEVYHCARAPRCCGSIDHIALSVTNIDALFLKMQEEGFTLLHNRVQSLPFWENGVRFFCIEGPNKEKIELIVRL